MHRRGMEFIWYEQQNYIDSEADSSSSTYEKAVMKLITLH